MISYEQLTEQHIREHTLKQKRCKEMDGEFLDRRPTLLSMTEAERETWRQDSVTQAGPMGLIDAVAQDLESFVELFERAPRCDLPPTPLRRRNVHIS